MKVIVIALLYKMAATTVLGIAVANMRKQTSDGCNLIIITR